MITEQQRQERKKGIGGSDVAAILGVSKFKTAVDVYFDKVGESMDEQNDAMQWGSILEPVILGHYATVTGAKEILKPGTIVSKEHPFMRANIDGALHNRTIIEAKTARSGEGWGQPGTHEMPSDYICQVAHYRIVTGAPKVDVAVLISGNDFRIYTYEKMEKFEDFIIEKEHDFWHSHVLPKVPPNPFNLDDFKKVYALSNGEPILATSEISRIIDELKSVKKLSKMYVQMEDDLEKQVKAFMGPYQSVVNEYGEELVTWKNRKENRVSVSDLKDKYPAIHKEMTKESQNRVFLVKK